jgi:hypothetical protein
MVGGDNRLIGLTNMIGYIYIYIYILERKSSGSGLENRKINGRRDPLR